jgi:hypothetical protein
LQSHFSSSTPPALCYIDDVGSYASNEIAINWNAPLVFVSGYFNAEGVSSVDDQGFNIVPDKFELRQNYPNPFNPRTIIQYAIRDRQFVTLKVYDVLGNEVTKLVDEFRNAGSYEVVFEPSSINHRTASGIYFYRLQAGDYADTKKMVLLK